jgi:hypothetical protein
MLKLQYVYNRPEAGLRLVISSPTDFVMKNLTDHSIKVPTTTTTTTTNHSSSSIRQAFIGLFCMAAAIPGFATEPLHDQYIVGALEGNIFPSKCCWMELPQSKRLTDMRMEEPCSAIGGPVGMFKLDGGRLWLTGLYKCSGRVDLHDIYPNLKSPALADWLSGTFSARLGFLCRDKNAQSVYSVEQVLIVEKGVVESLTETRNDISACATKN